MNHDRHIGIFDASSLSATLVGAGGIGAMTALMLVKMGAGSLVVYDGDTVSEENMPTQLHRLADLNRAKVYGLEETLQTFSDDTHIFPEDGFVTPETELSGRVIISGVDSIRARKDIWAAVKRSPAEWYLDARMAAEEFHLYAVPMGDPLKVEKYDRMIAAEDDSRVPDIPCTAKATFYTAAMASGHIGSAVRKILTGDKPAYYIVHNIYFDRLMVLER